MTIVYRVSINGNHSDAPIFSTLATAQRTIKAYRDYMMRRGCDIVKDDLNCFSAIWGGWESHQNTILITEIELDKKPATWDWERY